MKVNPCECGNQPHITSKYSDGTHYFSVVCLKCYTESEKSLSKDRAIKKWNKGIYKEEGDVN